MQVPIGLEEDFKGLIDLVQLKAYYFRGSSGSVSKIWCLCLFFFLMDFVLCFQLTAYCLVAVKM